MKPALIILTVFAHLAGTPNYFGPVPTSEKTVEIKFGLDAPKFALLVGINEYSDPQITDLRGPENDVGLIREMLTDSEFGFRFNGANVRELISSKTKKDGILPTKENIEKAFREHLIEKARKYREENPMGEGATVIFYYAGHGSYVDDQSTSSEGKDEADGLDETIVPMDSIDGSSDIRDDEIGRWFRELRKFTENVTFIFDSCHSGTVTRGTGIRSVIREKNNGVGVRTRGGEFLNETMDASGDYVTISGSLPNEKSQEDVMPVITKTGQRFPSGQSSQKFQWNGYMTYYLVQTLRQNQGLTYRELVQMVTSAVRRVNPDQTPQVEGDVDRAFLGSTASKSKRAIRIQKIEAEPAGSTDGSVKNTILTIEAGRIVGAMPGGLVGIYSPNASVLTGDKDRIAMGQIIESGNFSSRARVSDAAIPKDSKVVLVNPYFTDEKRKTAIDMSGAGAGLEMRKRLVALLANNDYVDAFAAKNVDTSADWSVAVKRGTFAEFKQGTTKSAKKDAKTDEALKVPNDADEVFYLANKNGNPLYNFYVEAREPGAEFQLKEALEKFIRIENLIALNNASAGSGINGGLKINLVRLKSCRRPDLEGEQVSWEEYSADELAQLKSTNTPVVKGDCFYFEIANDTEHDLYTYLYYISTDGSIGIAYAPVADGDILRRGGRVSTLSQNIFRAAEPFGRETAKLIATTQRFDSNLLVQPKVARSVVRSSASGLESLLVQAATNTRSERISVPFNGWGTIKLDYEVTSKP